MGETVFQVRRVLGTGDSDVLSLNEMAIDLCTSLDWPPERLNDTAIALLYATGFIAVLQCR